VERGVLQLRMTADGRPVASQYAQGLERGVRNRGFVSQVIHRALRFAATRHDAGADKSSHPKYVRGWAGIATLDESRPPRLLGPEGVGLPR
jgi:hypothetical protein